MKTKLFTLLTLLLCLGSSEVWGADSTPTFAQPTATLDLQASGLSTTLSGISWNSREGNVLKAYELTSDYLVFPLQTLGYTCPSWCVKENFNNNKGTWSASDPFKADSYFFSSTGDKNNTIKVTTTRPVAVKVTNCEGAYVYGATGTNYSVLNVYEVTNNTDAYNTFQKVKTANTNTNAVASVTGLTASKTYIIEVIGSTTSNANAYAIALNRAALSTQPTINTQPTSASYEAGDSPSSLSVSAIASDGALRYQWYKNTDGDTTGKEEDEIKDATSATLASANISTVSAGTYYYYCIVSDSNGSSTSDKATITVLDVIAPIISYASATNTVTITCAGSGTIYYTLDNSTPTSLSNEYSAPFVLTDASTVRAVAKKGENYSTVTFSNCYVNHSSSALAVLGHGGGTSAAGTWTSKNGDFKLTSSNSSSVDYYTIFTNSDAFKLNATNNYTLKVSDDIKVTSIKVVGISRADATYDATLALSEENKSISFSPASATFEKGTFVKTVEYTPASDLEYGAEILLTTGGNQFGAYIEVYGEKRTSPTAGNYIIAATWDFSTSAAQSASGSIGTSGSYVLKATNGKSTITYVGGSSDTYDSTNGYLKHGGSSSDTRYFILPITSDGTLGVTTKTNNGAFTIKKAANTTTTWKNATAFDPVVTITTTADGTEVTGLITYDANNPYLIIGFSNKLYTQKITWTPSVESVTLTTSTNMDGWRAFNPDGQGYTLDANTTAYIITGDKSDNKITLTKLAGPSGDIPGNTCVLLHTSSSVDSYKMTLTKKTVAAYSGDENKLKASSGQLSGVYRLGYGADEIAFYPYSGTPATGTVYLDVSSAEARALNIVFDDEETTGVAEVRQQIEGVKGNFFDLQGRKVAQPTKGLYIVNGRKVLIK